MKILAWQNARLHPRMRVRLLWRWVREVSGDAAYETYVRSRRRRSCEAHRGGAQGVLSREEFYLDMLQRRYSGVSRCC